jgi:hypothetical protein
MSIVQGIIRGFIGEWGMKVGDWYYQNSLWINGAILLYALLIYTSWKNYQSIKQFLIDSMTEQLSPKVKSWSKSEINRHSKDIEIPWDKARKKILVPLLTNAGNFLPKFASGKLIRELFPREAILNSLHEINKK